MLDGIKTYTTGELMTMMKRKEVAEYLDVTIPTVSRYYKKGVYIVVDGVITRMYLPFQKNGREVLFLRADVERFASYLNMHRLVGRPKNSLESEDDFLRRHHIEE